MGLKEYQFPGERRTTKRYLSSTGQQVGLTEHVSKIAGSIPLKQRREHLGFCAENMCNLRSRCAMYLLSSSVGSTLDDKYDLILALGSQIWDFFFACNVLKAFRALPGTGSFRKARRIGAFKPLTIVDCFVGLWSAGIRVRRHSAAAVLGPQQKRPYYTQSYMLPSFIAPGGHCDAEYMAIYCTRGIRD